MNIIDLAKSFVQSLEALARRTTWDWRRCPACGDSLTQKHGHYTVRPWFLDGRREVRIQRHYCLACQKTYSERSPYLVRGSWYAREVHRYSIDLWQHGRGLIRRSCEFVRSLLGRQERWLLWRLFESEPDETLKCRFSPSTLERWLDRAGVVATETVAGQLEGIASSGQVGVDGLWAKLKGQTKRVVLVLVDSLTGLIYPPVVVTGEEDSATWAKLFDRAKLAGFSIDGLRGVTSDGATGLLGLVNKTFDWVNHQRCVFHIWRSLSGEMAKSVAEGSQGLIGKAAVKARREIRRELVALIRGVIDAKSEAAAELALGTLKAHRLGTGLAALVEEHLDAMLVHLSQYNRGLARVGPEWLWRDYRLRVSRGRNHGSDVRLERAALVWQVYANFTPAQWRSERRRKYKRPGKSSLEMAGVPPGSLSYLDALRV